MKKNLYLLICQVVLMLTTSCNNILNLAPEDSFGDRNYWDNEAQVSNFMAGIHADFRNHQFMFIRLGEMRGGGFTNEDRQNTSLSELPVINQAISEISPGVNNWANFYTSIYQVNLFIEQVSRAGFLPENQKNHYLGQAYAIRAFYYFQLLRTYGGVPVITSPDVRSTNNPVDLRTPRATEEEVLNFLKEDINQSVALFESGDLPLVKNLWNFNSALMLKGEIYLWSVKVYENYSDLSTAKEALLAVKGTRLLNDFKEVFDYENKNNDEIILAIRYLINEAEMAGYNTFLYQLANFSNLHYKDSSGTGELLVDPLEIATSGPIQRYGYTFELFQSYDLEDQRRDATFYDYYRLDLSSGTPVVTVRNTALTKFMGTINNNRRYFSSDWPVYREADRLLMLAEISNAEGIDPTPYVKLIRDRAFGGETNDPAPFTNGSRDENELAIFSERSKEFVYEGKRWYDIRRMKYGEQPLVFKNSAHPYGVLDKSNPDENYKILWPIDIGVWTNDPTVEQTPGYATSKP